ncbi:MAG: hypothetical protein KJ884_04365 [Gammaproteobacteria bacterium]|nr:hypothetical protein [Gammaproteobacteria bacterium]MBU1490095.1 hypothetical protein [Gammaproteobacteria bacterium]MBU2066858.1 hypothetical protein [Gammaproteobacteria bacterium]MBU2139526.1 hypothetical protein [Gammaproteobacteria bacterium]MBU2216961.1 hypothetical protein [Gammaproteobacteria bacterium]
MKVHRISFHGGLLERGFWLYAWLLKNGGDKAVYVGRTGDSSSQFAASPFSRLSQHLDVRPSATANMLLRQVRKLGWDPLICEYELVAFGPMFPEQADLEQHRVKRDVIAPLETALATLFREQGFKVVGSHGKQRDTDPALLKQVERAFHKVFG